MLMPKRVKRRRQMRGRMKGNANKGNRIAYGEYGLVAAEPCWITSNQIEAARVAMTRYIKRGGQVWVDIFPHKPVTKKPAGTRMGSGKGSPEYWVAVSSMYHYTYTPDLSTRSSFWCLTSLRNGKSHLKVCFALRCFQRLSSPDIATQLCYWHNNWFTSGLSNPVLSY